MREQVGAILKDFTDVGWFVAAFGGGDMMKYETGAGLMQKLQ